MKLTDMRAWLNTHDNLWILWVRLLVGTFEILCGALISIGLLTRFAAIPLIIVMIVAIMSTKVPILLGHGFWGFHLVPLSRYGFLVIAGGGRWSVDARLCRGRLPSMQTDAPR